MSKFKNTSFWLFTLFIAIAFSLLLWLQFEFVNHTRTIIINQFADAVQRSLYRTVKSVEEAEVLTYIDEAFKNDTPETRKAKEAINAPESPIVLKPENVAILSPIGPGVIPEIAIS